MKIQLPKLPVLSNNFIADLLRYLCKNGWPSPHTVQKKLQPPFLCLNWHSFWTSYRDPYSKDLLHMQTGVFGSSSKGCNIGLNWKTCISKGKSSSTFANTDVNQEYAFDSWWCYTARARNWGQKGDLECCQVEAIFGWYLFWNPIETIISKFIKLKLQMLK